MGFFWGDLHGKLHVVKAVVVRVGEEDGQGEGFCLVHQDTHAAPETVWGVVEGAAFRGSRWDDGAGGHGVVATEAVGPGGAQGHIPRAVGELDLHAPKGMPSIAYCFKGIVSSPLTTTFNSKIKMRVEYKMGSFKTRITKAYVHT